MMLRVSHGRKTGEVSELGVSAATLYALEEQVGGMQVSDAKRLRQLEEENRLNQMVADLSLGKEAIKRSLQNGWSS